MIFTLQPGVGVRLPAQLLTVRLQGPGSATAGELEAVATGPDGTERGIDDIVRHPGMLVLAVHGPTMIRVRPPAGQDAFPATSQFALVVGSDHPDSDRATVKRIDASGLRSCDLITLTPSAQDIVVTAVAQPVQVALPAVAARSRVAAREVVGAPKAPAEERVSVRVVIDSSASLRVPLHAGWVGTAVELLSGIASVVSELPILPAIACGRTLVALEDHRLDESATRLVEEVVELPPSIGFRASLVPDGGGHGLTYVITDAQPADLGEARRDLVHLVLLGAAPTAEAGAQGTPATTIDSSGEPSMLTERQIAVIVRSLLSGYRKRFGAERKAAT